ncbi:hypothetical protein [Wolbachia endosymbiont of Chironomus riparius]|uniref:hypothetical protein n=1 Tax=Wolbachia endosymbiont of Chironomus riparius TaxID=2883238 RepID=UPI00209D15F6|nr:hypothetical protein [Wolbachia endosymbiont of Chironomus riparius]
MKKKVLIFLIISVVVALFVYDHNSFFHEDVMHIESGEFKKKPEIPIESTILHREKEVYEYIFGN